MSAPYFLTVTLSPAVDVTWRLRNGFVSGGVHIIQEEVALPGGKGINVAKALSSAGAGVRAAGIVGAAELPAFDGYLQEEGLETTFLAVPFATRGNTMISAANGAEMKFNRPAFPMLDYDAEAIRRHVLEAASGVSVVVMAGSLPARFPAETYRELARAARAEGKVVVLDAAGAALAAGAEAGPEVLKPNLEELEALMGRKVEGESGVRAAVEELLVRHETVVVSLGAEGALFADRGAMIRAVAPKVEAVDTTGAGDTLLGWFCAKYFPARRLTEEAAAFAVAAGAAMAEERGVPFLNPRRVSDLASRARTRVL